MTNSKSTKRALLTSVLAMLLCVLMLVGTTFAWFTDSASTGVNKIVAGNLKMEVSYKNTPNADEFSPVDKDTPVLKDGALWEPGHVEFAVLKVKNVGTLALKYKLGINIASETGSTNVLGNTFNLSNYIKFAVLDGDKSNLERADLVTAAGTGAAINTGYNTTDISLAVGAEKVVTLVVWMPDSVGNEANHATNADAPVIELGINVVATQDTVESDSFDNKYDENATYPQVFKATDTASLNDALDSVTTADKKNVDITLDGTNKTYTDVKGINPKAGNNLGVDMNGNTIEIGGSVGSSSTETNGAQFLKGSSVVLENGTYKFADNNQYKKILIQNYSNLTLNNVNLDASNVSYALSTNCGNVTIKGNTNITVMAGGTALDVMHWENNWSDSQNKYVDTSYKADGTHVVFDESMTGTVDGKISVYCWRNNSIVSSVEDGGATLVIKGGTFKNSGLDVDQFKAFVPTGYTVTTNTDGSFTVSKA